MQYIFVSIFSPSSRKFVCVLHLQIRRQYCSLHQRIIEATLAADAWLLPIYLQYFAPVRCSSPHLNAILHLYLEETCWGGPIMIVAESRLSQVTAVEMQRQGDCSSHKSSFATFLLWVSPRCGGDSFCSICFLALGTTIVAPNANQTEPLSSSRPPIVFSPRWRFLSHRRR